MSDFSFLFRLDLLSTPSSEGQAQEASLPDIAVSSSAPSQSPVWLPGFVRWRPASVRLSPSLAWARPTDASQIQWRALRARRHVHSGSRVHPYPQHAQLMRVGCVLGTCQVQNLSHRLYQLIGQSGREDSSPINPRSPHSYG